MFGFGKKKKERIVYVKEHLRYVWDINYYTTHFCDVQMEDDGLYIMLEDKITKIKWENITSCGRVDNTKHDVDYLINQKILSQATLSTPGFVVGEFYTFNEFAKTFLIIKFKDEEEQRAIHTLLLECNENSKKILKVITEKVTGKLDEYYDFDEDDDDDDD